MAVFLRLAVYAVMGASLFMMLFIFLIQYVKLTVHETLSYFWWTGDLALSFWRAIRWFAKSI